jgi:hypothetical protein
VLHVTPPNPHNAVVTVCARLSDHLPEVLDKLQSRLTTPRSPLVHAWGNAHPVVLRCGVPVPPSYAADSPQTAQVDTVSWFQQIEPTRVIWTAVRRTANIELSVPRSYEAQGAFLVAIGAAISATIS